MLAGRQALKLLSTKTRCYRYWIATSLDKPGVNLWKLTDLSSGTVKLELCKSPLEMKYFDVHAALSSEPLGYRKLCSCPNMTALNWSVNLDSIPTINEYKGVL